VRSAWSTPSVDGALEPADDARRKAEHAIRLMHVARELAALALTERQRRILARYVYLNAEPALAWIGRRAKALDASPETRDRACAARTPLRRLRTTWAREKSIRDKLAAKRQSVSPRRSEDLRATVALWEEITNRGVDELYNRAAAVHDALGGDPMVTALDERTRNAVRAALEACALDPGIVYTDSTSYALGEPNLLAVADSGKRGIRVTQINDVHVHLEVLYELRELAKGTDDLGLMLRAAAAVEGCTLVELVAGPPSDTNAFRSRRRSPSLRELVVHDPERDGTDVLGLLRGDLFERWRGWLHETRDKAAAHLDGRLPLDDIVDRLTELDIDQLYGFVDGVIDLLDFAAGVGVRLGLLVLGNRPIGGIEPAAGGSVPASVESHNNVALLDHDMVAWSAGGFSQPTNARVSGIIAGRAMKRRERWFKAPN